MHGHSSFEGRLLIHCTHDERIKPFLPLLIKLNLSILGASRYNQTFLSMYFGRLRRLVHDQCREPMDNLTHTLYGLALANTGLRRTAPHATLTLIIASNLPDVDSLSLFWGQIHYLKYHRGVTHSL